MLEITKGKIHPEALSYMTSILRHERWSGYTSFGFGLPPASIIYTKIGVAYDTTEEIAHVVLPNHQEFILSAFSNGYEPDQPAPYSTSVFGAFAESLIELVPELNKGLPPKIKLDNEDPSFFTKGTWQVSSSAPGIFGKSFAQAYNATTKTIAGWNVKFAEAGMYEVCVWHPFSHNFASNAVVTIHHLYGSDSALIDQRYRGGRWIYLGGFLYAAGQTYAITINPSANLSPNQALAANGVKFTQWPTCDGVIGTACPNPQGTPL